MNPLKRLGMAGVDLYRKKISPAKGSPCCRFSPSCSNYAYHAINEWGFLIGAGLAIFRILRCSPLFKGGADGVPRKRRKLIPKTLISAQKHGKKAVKKHRNAMCGAFPSYPYLSYYENYI